MKIKRWLILAALLVLISVLTVGCAGQTAPAPTSTATPTPVPSPKPAAKPAPAPSPKPTATPASPTANTGTLEVRATDAPPSGVSKIMVTVTNIQVHQADAPDDKWITVMNQAQTFDLVEIQGKEISLGKEQVTTGKYTQIRVDVSKVVVTLEGKDITAKLPGDKIKLVGSWEVKPNDTTILTLDFEADKFVVLTGKNEAHVKPTIKLDVSYGSRPLKGGKKPGTEPPPPTRVPAAPNDSIVTGKVVAIRSIDGKLPWEIDIEIQNSQDVPGRNNATKDKVGQTITVRTKEKVESLKAGQVITAHVQLEGDERGSFYSASDIK